MIKKKREKNQHKYNIITKSQGIDSIFKQMHRQLEVLRKSLGQL